MWAEPLGLEFIGAFNLMDPGLNAGDRCCQLTGVVALASSDDHDDIRSGCQLHGCQLSPFGGLADRILEDHLALRVAGSNGIDEMLDSIHGLGGLRHDTDTGNSGYGIDVGYLENDRTGCQIPSQTLNLDMIVASYDDGEIALIHQLCQVTMRKVNQRAGGIFQGKPCFSCLFMDTLGHAMSCDEDCPFIGLIGTIYELDAGLMEPILNYWIVCQGSKNVQFSFLG